MDGRLLGRAKVEGVTRRKLVAARSSNSFSPGCATSVLDPPAVVHVEPGFAESAPPHFLFEAKLDFRRRS